MMTPSKAFFLCLISCMIASQARAALLDEIQVYDDTISKPSESGLDLHLNTTPSGRSTPDYPGEVVPAHGIRLTPEVFHGLTESVEAGVQLPLVRDRDNNYYLAGAALSMKWIGKRAPTGGLFYGTNIQLSHVGSRFEQATNSVELRPILGYRTKNWLFVTNPVLGYDLNRGYRAGGFDFNPAFKVTRKLAEGIAVGAETYSELGKLSDIAPRSEQKHTLYAVVDVKRGSRGLNFGIGRGLNPATDRWTIKAIFEIRI